MKQNLNLIIDLDSKIKFISLNILHGKLMADRFNLKNEKLSSKQYIQQLMDEVESIMK